MQEKKDYIDPVPSVYALPEIHAFRSAFPNQGHGVWYYPKDISEYLEKDFPKFVADHPLSLPYVWVVGHYFKIHKGRLSFFVIPTKLNTETNKIEDRVSGQIYPSVRSEYPVLAKSESKENDPIGDDEAFDKGDMWP